MTFVTCTFSFFLDTLIYIIDYGQIVMNLKKHFPQSWISHKFDDYSFNKHVSLSYGYGDMASTIGYTFFVFFFGDGFKKKLEEREKSRKTI